MGGTGAFLALQKNSQAQTRRCHRERRPRRQNRHRSTRSSLKTCPQRPFRSCRNESLAGKRTGLLNSCWDWGAAISKPRSKARGHMGNKDIANFLLSKGARMNIFCAAMLGRLDVVKAIPLRLSRAEDLERSARLAMLHHATKGGVEPTPMLEILKIETAPQYCAKSNDRCDRSQRVSPALFPQWRHVRGVEWIFLRSSIASSSRLLLNGLARFKEAASSNGQRTCDREESDNSFHSANN